MQITQNKLNKLNPGSVASYDLRPGNKQSGTRDGQKKKIVKATEKREKWKRRGREGTRGEGSAPAPRVNHKDYCRSGYFFHSKTMPFRRLKMI